MQPSEETRNRQELRKAFVAGATWWEFHIRHFITWEGDRQEAEKEAEKRYGKAEGKGSGSDERDKVCMGM